MRIAFIQWFFESEYIDIIYRLKNTPTCAGPEKGPVMYWK